MHVKRRRLPNFEACSVALFASLALYGPLPSKAHTATSSSALSAASTGRPRANPALPTHRRTPEQLRQAASRLDAQADDPLSQRETFVSPEPAAPFDPIDAHRDGSISSAGFDESLK